MKKRAVLIIGSLLIAVLLCFAGCSSSASSKQQESKNTDTASEEVSGPKEIKDSIASGECGRNVYWTLSKKGVLYITGTGDMEDCADADRIDWDDYRSKIKSVKIEDGVTSIGSFAFEGCKKLKSIDIPEGVSSIGLDAFVDCKKLKSISIPKTVTSIEPDAFYNCTSLTSIKLPSHLTKISDGTFMSCKSLKKITIPKSVKSIGEMAFDNCHKLKKVKFGGKKSAWKSMVKSSLDGEGGNDVLITATVTYGDGSTAKSKVPKGSMVWLEAPIGEKVTIYGKVASTDYASSSNGRPTFLDIGIAYPRLAGVTVVIWEENLSAFSHAPESYYLDKIVCVTGTVYEYEGRRQIEVTSPSQIKVLY